MMDPTPKFIMMDFDSRVEEPRRIRIYWNDFS